MIKKLGIASVLIVSVSISARAQLRALADAEKSEVQAAPVDLAQAAITVTLSGTTGLGFALFTQRKHW